MRLPRQYLRACSLIAVLLSLYPISFLVVFDLQDTAYCWDEENFGSQQVAVGPRPRWVFDKPRCEGILYSPKQWSFTVYRPLCILWLKLNGYAVPYEWR
jgi:hypothetical protein